MDKTVADVDEFVSVTQVRLHHIFLTALVSVSIIGICTAGSLFAFGAILRTNDSRASRAERIAKRADARSQASAVRLELQKEKVCSQSSNRIIACQALFERLARAISDPQRDRLACVVVLHLRGPTADALRRENPQCKEAP